MRFLIGFIIVLTLLVSCKNSEKSKKIEDKKEDAQTEEVQDQSLDKGIAIALPNQLDWEKKNVLIEDVNEYYGDTLQVKKLVSKGDVSYLSLKNTKLSYKGDLFRIKVLVKGMSDETFFALRFQEIYPNRVDAIFDLKKGKVKKVVKTGNAAEEEKASIKALGNGWYECSLEAQLYSDYIGILLGVTNNMKGPKNWEASSAIDDSVLFVPSSLSLENIEGNN